jgi:hypothetical protein
MIDPPHGLVAIKRLKNRAIVRDALPLGRHRWLVFGLKADGTPDGTVVRFIDPAAGKVHEASFAGFIDLVAPTARRDRGNSTGGRQQIVID